MGDFTVLRNRAGDVAVANLDLANESVDRTRALIAGGLDFVDLSWTAMEGATGYDIYRDDVFLLHTADTSLRDSDLTPNEYTYTVRPSGKHAEGGFGIATRVGSETLGEAQEGVIALAAAASAKSRVVVQWNTFIPSKYIAAPNPIAGVKLCGEYSDSSKYKFAGDDRGFQASGWPYRTKLQGSYEWGSLVFTPYKDIWSTKVYNSAGTLLATKTAFSGNISVTKLAGSSATSVDMRFVLHAGNPFCKGAIDGAMTITAKKSGTWSIISGNYRQMPNHEIYISDQSSWKTVHKSTLANANCLAGQMLCPLGQLGSKYGSY